MRRGRAEFEKHSTFLIVDDGCPRRTTRISHNDPVTGNLYKKLTTQELSSVPRPSEAHAVSSTMTFVASLRKRSVGCVYAGRCVYVPDAAFTHTCLYAGVGAYTQVRAYTHLRVRIRG